MAEKKQNKLEKTEEAPKDIMSVETFIQKGLEAKASAETMEKLFDLHERVQAKHAKTSFVQALSAFQRDVPVIEKTKKVMNKDGRSVRYMYAPLESIVAQIKDILDRHGLSYTWDVKNEKDFITAICRVTHIDGHSETSEFGVPVDSNQYMSSPQRYASALTFAKRYTLCDALGIATAEEDTDAVDVDEKDGDAVSVKSQIVMRLKRLGYDTGTREEVEASVEDVVDLKLEEKNYQDIADRLQVLIEQKEEMDIETIE